jgi:hypothetical protein
LRRLRQEERYVEHQSEYPTAQKLGKYFEIFEKEQSQ